MTAPFLQAAARGAAVCVWGGAGTAAGGARAAGPDALDARMFKETAAISAEGAALRPHPRAFAACRPGCLRKVSKVAPQSGETA